MDTEAIDILTEITQYARSASEREAIEGVITLFKEGSTNVDEWREAAAKAHQFDDGAGSFASSAADAAAFDTQIAAYREVTDVPLWKAKARLYL